MPFTGSAGPPVGALLDALPVDSTMAGQAFQGVSVLTQRVDGSETRAWLPLLNGVDRLGVLGVTLPDPRALEADCARRRGRFQRQGDAPGPSPARG